MALYNGRILMRIGNEANYDIDKLMPGEWAVSTDKRIVRICVSAGIGIRMATYEAFEEDMAKIEEILNQCQTIQEAVEKINAEISEKANAVAEYTNEAKKYRDEAKKYRDESYNTTPEGYYELVKNVEENTVKIDSIIEKAELTIKNTASGESVHLTDSSGNKVVEFALYGKAKQNTESSKNILNPTIPSGTYGNIQLTVNSDKSILLNGTSENRYNYSYPISTNIIPEESGGYRLNGSPSDYCSMYVVHSGSEDRAYTDSTKTVRQSLNQGASNKEVYYYLEAGVSYDVRMNLPEYGIALNNITLYPMLRPANTDNTYEPYTGVIPNPDNLQEIEISGANGSVVVKSCGKNILKNTATSKTDNGVTFTVNEDKTITVKGTNNSTARVKLEIDVIFNKGTYFVTGCPIGGNSSTYAFYIQKSDGSGKMYWETGNGVKFDVEEDNTLMWVGLARINAGYTANNLLFKPMIRRCDKNGNPIGDDSYEPHKETSATIPTPNGLAGITNESGGNYTDETRQQWVCDVIVKYADGTGEKIHRIKKVVFDGVNIAFTSKSSSTANNIFMADQKTRDFKSPSSDRELANVISSHFTTKASYYGYREGTPCIYGNVGYTNIYFGFGIDSEITTVDLANEWLKSNNVTVYYELATPIRTPLTAEEVAEIEKLQTFYPVTNIINDSDCGMKVTYLADSKNYIDNQLALQVQAQEAAMINMLLLLPDETQAAMIENDTNNLLTESEE